MCRVGERERERERGGGGGEGDHKDETSSVSSLIRRAYCD